MDFEKFKQKIKEEMQFRLGTGSVEIRETIKNNSVKRTGMILSRPGDEASPVIYLDAWHEKLCGGKGFGETVEEIWGLYLQYAGKTPLDKGEFMDWKRVRKKVSVRLVHYQKNREMLEDVPHRRFLDLAEAYYFTAETGRDGFAAVLITDSHMDYWGICQRELREAAYENHKKNGGTKIQTMDKVIREMLGALADSGCSPIQMYVATNRFKLGGAAAMLFAGEFSGLAQELGSDLYILPSSIHEILLLPVSAGKPEELAEIVKEVNRTQVMPEERLSDSVYLYDRKSGEIRIA